MHGCFSRRHFIAQTAEQGTRVNKRILLNLCIALFCVYITFLIGIEPHKNDNDFDIVDIDIIACNIISLLLVYFLLCAFMWMLVEATLQFLVVVIFSPRLPRQFFLKSAFIAWGMKNLK